MDREKVIKKAERIMCSTVDRDVIDSFCEDVITILEDQESMNVDAFVQWCIDSHIMGDATVRGIKYWVGKYKEIKEGR